MSEQEKILTEFERRIREYPAGYEIPSWAFRQHAYTCIFRRHSQEAILRHQLAIKAVFDRAEARAMKERGQN
jgi:hypothetical protein